MKMEVVGGTGIVCGEGKFKMLKRIMMLFELVCVSSDAVVVSVRPLLESSTFLCLCCTFDCHNVLVFVL